MKLRNVSFLGFRYQRVGMLTVLSFRGIAFYRRCGRIRTFRLYQLAEDER